MGGANPFASGTGAANPFQAAKPPPPTINQLRSQTSFPVGGGSNLPSNDLLGMNFNFNSTTASNAASSQSLLSSGPSLGTGFNTIPGNNPFAM